MTSIDSSTSTHTTISSRLVIWPRRRRRPTNDVGFILGWKSINEIDSKNGFQRETMICAGVLSPTESMPTYRQRLAMLRDHVSESKPKRCPCLVRSLDIVGIWTASPNTPIPDALATTGLEIITQQRKGFPWWKTDKEKDTTSTEIQKQLVFYVPPGVDPKDAHGHAHAHFHTEYGHHNAAKEWSLLVYQLNHSQQLFQYIQTGTMPTLAVLQTPTYRTISSSSTSSKDDTEDNQPTNMAPHKSWVSHWKAFILQNSMTLLHFQHIYEQQQHTSFLYFLSFLSIVRCLRYLPTLSSHVQSSSICILCRESSLFQERSKGAQQYVTRWNRWMEIILDCFLGVAAALVLFIAWQYSHPNINVWSYYADSRRWSMNTLTKVVSQLEQFPAGFKLNVSLTRNMGDAIRHILQLQRRFLESTLWNLEFGQQCFLPFLFFVSGICGWNTLLAVLIDLWRLETLHLWILTTAFRYMYQTELFLLSALFRLFRGKKRNILRQRTDSMQYDAMQLLVGTIIFCICIFLWTTIMVYYTSFVIINWVCNLPVVCLWVTYIIGRAVPWGSLGWWMWKPEWFAQSVYLESMSDVEQDVRVVKMCSKAKTLQNVLLSHLTVHICGVTHWIFHGLLEALIPRRSNDAPCSIPISRMMQHLRWKENGGQLQ